MRLRWTPAAADDLEHISNYLREHHPQFQQPTIRKLYQRICDLKKQPYSGRIGVEEGRASCCFSHCRMSPHIALKGDAIEILRISHLAQERRQ